MLVFCSKDASVAQVACCTCLLCLGVVCFVLDPLEMLSCPVVLFTGPWRVCAGGRWEANQVGFLPSSVFLLTGNSPWSFEARPRVMAGALPTWLSTRSRDRRGTVGLHGEEVGWPSQ